MYYVIQVRTGEEQKAIDDIKRFNTNRSESFEVFAPYRKGLRKYNGVLKEVTERCFPGYVFVETNDDRQLFFDLYWVPGFAKLLGRAGKESYHFTPLNQDEARMVDILYAANNNRVTPLLDIEIEEGDKIRILDGPLMDLEAKIIKVNLHKRKVTVEIPLFNRTMQADVGINIISKAL